MAVVQPLGMSVQEAADLLDLSTVTINRWCKDKHHLTGAVKKSGVWWIPASEVHMMLEMEEAGEIKFKRHRRTPAEVLGSSRLHTSSFNNPPAEKESTSNAPYVLVMSVYKVVQELNEYVQRLEELVHEMNAGQDELLKLAKTKKSWFRRLFN